MKLIIKNDNRDIVKNPNIKIIETTEASFTNQIVFIESNDVPIIKYTDTGVMYFIKDLDNLYDQKSKSEVLLNITIDNLESANGGGNSRPYEVYTALLTQSGTDAPVVTVLENTLGNVTFSKINVGFFKATTNFLLPSNKTFISISNSRANLGDLSINSVSHNIGNNDNEIFIETFNSTGVKTDSTLLQNRMYFEIRVYN